MKWWAQRDLNPRPSDYESPALTPELWAPQNGSGTFFARVRIGSKLFSAVTQILRLRPDSRLRFCLPGCLGLCSPGRPCASQRLSPGIGHLPLLLRRFARLFRFGDCGGPRSLRGPSRFSRSRNSSTASRTHSPFALLSFNHKRDRNFTAQDRKEVLLQLLDLLLDIRCLT